MNTRFINCEACQTDDVDHGVCPECKGERVVEVETESAGPRGPLYVKTLEDLVRCLIENDPEDLAADGGIRVIDVWRKDAERALAVARPERNPTENIEGGA